MLKFFFFYLKIKINEKNSDEFFYLFFLVAHMFLKTNSTVRKNGIFDSLWGGIQRCVGDIADLLLGVFFSKIPVFQKNAVFTQSKSAISLLLIKIES